MAPSPMGGPLETAAPGPPGYGCGLVHKMAAANPLWGAPRIHGELRKLGIAVSERTVSRLLPRPGRPPSQTWRTFLANHATALVSMDFFTVPTLTGRVLFVFVLLAHQRRRVVHLAITDHPTAAWTAQQIIEAFPEDTAPRWLVRDRDAIYSDVFRRRLASMSITEVIAAPSSPWQNPFAERLIGSLRRRVSGPRHHSEPKALALRACSIRLLLPSGENSSLPREGRARATTHP
jgi:putative transposase